jgi:hypothetical protein
MTSFPKVTLIAAAAAVGMALSACGSNEVVVTNPPPQTGVFLDAAVEGLDYTAGSNTKGTTNASGEFSCIVGDTVAFSIGGLALGSASCGAVLTPLSLSGVEGV